MLMFFNWNDDKEPTVNS